jgi:ABC-2 type transport system permease protein
VSAVAGTGALVRLALRRDRIMLPIWLYSFVAVAAGSASATIRLYPTVASRVQAARSIDGIGGLVALYGRIYDPTSLGAVSMIKLGGLGGALVAVLAMLLVVRHTRAEEETGRLELLGGAVLGRYAALAAALAVAVGTNVLLGLLTAVGLIVVGLPAAGSVAFGLAWAGTGIAFAAVAAATAQLTESARTALGLATAVLGVAYLLRAAGDVAGPGGPGWLSWLSPVGWGQQVRPFAGERWWVLLLPVGFASVVVAASAALVARRDLGAGLVPARPGPAAAGRWLRGPLGLAWRLHRGLLLAWAAGFAVFGAVLGSVAADVRDLLGSQQSRDLFTRLGGSADLTDAFLATELGFFGIAAAAYGVQAALRLRAEESGLRAEPVLATAVGRVRWLASHLVIALAGSAAVLVAGGAAAGLAHAARTGDLGQAARVVGGALAYVPAVSVLTGIVVATFGLWPRLVAVGWAALGVFLLLGELGPVLKLDQWALDVSPFTHVPRLPGAAVTATPLIWLTAAAMALVAAGLAGFRARDVEGGG